MKNFNICFVGFGSIAKRHIANIHYIFEKKKEISVRIDLLRRIESKKIDTRYLSQISRIYNSLAELPEQYDAIFITNPTQFHYETLKELRSRSKNFFIEKPVFSDTTKNIFELGLDKGGIYYVACPLRYTGVIQYIKNNIDLSEIYSVRCISSSYLPEWRPGTDYRTVYSAHSEMGGGVSIDLIHEWDYICYLFGFPEQVNSIIDKVSNLEIDSDDTAVYIAKCNKKIIELHLDYYGRKTIRRIELFGKNDTILADLVENTITFLSSGKVITLREDRDAFQIRELKTFFRIISGKEKNINTIENACQVLKIARGES